jgi:antitoxin MazE
MTAKVQRWGNSLAIRIPKSFAKQSNLHADTPVEMTIEGEVISLRAVSRKRSRYTLEELLEGVTAENCHEEISTGQPVGKEVW